MPHFKGLDIRHPPNYFKDAVTKDVYYDFRRIRDHSLITLPCL